MELQDPIILNKLKEILMFDLVNEQRKMDKHEEIYVHYTSAENALNILNSKTLWLRNPLCMNDFMEMEHGYRLLSDTLNNKKNKKKFFKAVNQYKNGFADRVLELFNHGWQSIKNDTYITSISVHPKNEDKYGRLSMWRAYGSETGKAALVIKRLDQSQNSGTLKNVYFHPVSYFTEKDLETYLLKMIDSINNNIDFLKRLKEDTLVSALAQTLIFKAICLKHPGFKEEKEWRIIYWPSLDKINILKKEIETINGIPQLVCKLPLQVNNDLRVTFLSVQNFIDKIIIGPSQYPIPMLRAFHEALYKSGIKDTKDKVIFSTIPLRT